MLKYISITVIFINWLKLRWNLRNIQVELETFKFSKSQTATDRTVSTTLFTMNSCTSGDIPLYLFRFLWQQIYRVNWLHYLKIQTQQVWICLECHQFIVISVLMLVDIVRNYLVNFLVKCNQVTFARSILCNILVLKTIILHLMKIFFTSLGRKCKNVKKAKEESIIYLNNDWVFEPIKLQKVMTTEWGDSAPYWEL